MLSGSLKCEQGMLWRFWATEFYLIRVTSRNDIQYGDLNTEVLTF